MVPSSSSSTPDAAAAAQVEIGLAGAAALFGLVKDQPAAPLHQIGRAGDFAAAADSSPDAGASIAASAREIASTRRGVLAASSRISQGAMLGR